ncbi:hypothetical protein DFJ58DRAFT_840903 [Suillus subalutaceus]|uniref:uncharacterized protein n=1 Tax=Suillus subalutaceus TaxID=48586 RepID=UPI001B8862DE|nr:uncharacterized protein DFJ58DRAFT_840903 [Suillus subalutaceus]KAG1856392.1 hypothetical protein DFJ58DRAFT_840903 [Suillus subalutaceus]
MKGFLSLVLVSIALLQMTAAAPAASEHSQGISLIALTLFSHPSYKNVDDTDVEKRNVWYGQYTKDDTDVEKRDRWIGSFVLVKDDDEVIDNPEEALGRLGDRWQLSGSSF